MIYLDMDGVLADFEGWASSIIGPDWKKEIDEPKWGKFALYPRLYAELPVMEKALELYEFCCEYIGDETKVGILTALPNRARDVFPMAAQDKTEWARKNINKSIRVNFGPFAVNKQLHCVYPTDILIDDMKINIDQWNSKGGIGLQHTSCSDIILKLQELTL
jgi:hypothetical protein